MLVQNDSDRYGMYVGHTHVCSREQNVRPYAYAYRSPYSVLRTQHNSLTTVPLYKHEANVVVDSCVPAEDGEHYEHSPSVHMSGLANSLHARAIFYER